MAASQLEREDSLLEPHRTSLLEVIEDKNRTLSKKNLVHRLVYIGKLKEGVENRTDVGAHYERLVKNLQNNFQTEPMTGLLLVYLKHIVHVLENNFQTESMTGLLLVYLKHIVHVLEASSDMVTEVMKDIMDTQCSDFLEGAKILVISHDISTRLYQNWNFRTLDIQAARMESYESSEGAEKIVIDLLSQLLKLGNKLAITPKVAFKSTLDSLHEKFPDLLPQQAHLHYLMEENDSAMILPEEYLSMYQKPFDVVLEGGHKNRLWCYYLMEENDSAMILPEEYLSMYQKPFDVVLEGELVWPLPTKLFPYN